VVTSDVWKLDLSELRWERMPSLTLGRYDHACCAVRGGVAVLGGCVEEAEDDESESEEADEEITVDTVEILGSDAEAQIFGYDSEVEESIFLSEPQLTPVRPCIRTPPRQRRHCCHRIHSKNKHSRHPSSPRQRQTSQLTSNVATQKTFSPPLLTASASNVTTKKFTPRHRCRAANFTHPSRDLIRPEN
jgi:hypothetical protein